MLIRRSAVRVNLLVNSLSKSLFARLDALTASIAPVSVPQSSSQPSQGPDAELPQPGVTTGESRMFQALGAASRTSDTNVRLGKGVRTPRQEYVDPSAASQPHAAPELAPQPPLCLHSLLRIHGFHHPNLPRQGGSPQDDLLLVHVALARHRSRRLARLKVKLPLVITLLLASLTSFTRLVLTRFRFWMILVARDATLRDGSASLSALLLDLASGFTPGLGEVESEVTARAEALARRSKPLSQLLPSRSNRHAVADLPLYASSLAVNPSFAKLSGAKAVGSRRWGSISFSEMERLERLFRSQLEMTSKSLWLMSGILAMLKHDGFQPADPTLFNAALASVFAALSLQARSSASGSTFIRTKCRDSLLSHTAIPVPETQRHALTVSPGSESLLFNEEILGVVVTQVQQSSHISSKLAVSRSLGRGRGRFSSSPLLNPSAAGSSHSSKPHGKRSPSSSRYGGRERFRVGKGSAPSSGPSGFRK